MALSTTTESIEQMAMPLSSDLDVLKARQQGKRLAASLHFSTSELTIIATAISEIARNAVLYAKSGRIALSVVQHGKKRGVQVVTKDNGPGIEDLALVMQDGYSTSHGLGIGLPGARRLMDEFDIVSEVGKGTVITMKKWER